MITYGNVVSSEMQDGDLVVTLADGSRIRVGGHPEGGVFLEREV